MGLSISIRKQDEGRSLGDRRVSQHLTTRALTGQLRYRMKSRSAIACFSERKRRQRELCRETLGLVGRSLSILRIIPP